MKPIRIEAGPGDRFGNVAENAKNISIEKNAVVAFDFNGVECLVDKNTNLDNLFRDYCNAHTMDWKTVGPNCVDVYDAETQATLDQKETDAESARKQRAAQQEIEDKKKSDALDTKIKDIVFEFKSPEAEEEWKAGRAKNTDPYGNACFVYADRWARLMQAEAKDYTNIDVVVLTGIADKASTEADIEGITGFMYGMAVSILSKVWKHGEALRKWHNKEYNHEGDGVVNPAVLTIGK